MTGNAGDPLDLVEALDRNGRIAALPSKNGGFVDGRRKELPELLEAHLVVVGAEFGDRRLLHGVLFCCISCNLMQERELHVGITMDFRRLGTVAR